MHCAVALRYNLNSVSPFPSLYTSVSTLPLADDMYHEPDVDTGVGNHVELKPPSVVVAVSTVLQYGNEAWKVN